MTKRFSLSFATFLTVFRLLTSSFDPNMLVCFFFIVTIVFLTTNNKQYKQ